MDCEQVWSELRRRLPDVESFTIGLRCPVCFVNGVDHQPPLVGVVYVFPSGRGMLFPSLTPGGPDRQVPLAVVRVRRAPGDRPQERLAELPASRGGRGTVEEHLATRYRWSERTELHGYGVLDPLEDAPVGPCRLGHEMLPTTTEQALAQLLRLDLDLDANGHARGGDLYACPA